MKFKAEMTMASGLMALLIFAGCGGSGDSGLCEGIHCDDPPANSCKDASTLLDYPDTGTCQLDTGECQYTPVEKNCAGGCRDGACESSGDDFIVEIPAGTRLCSLFQSTLGQSDIKSDYTMKGRVTLKAGSFSLPKDQDSFAADWIERVEFGPGRTVLDPKSGGQVTRTLQGNAENGTYLYDYTQDFLAGDETLQLTYRGRFKVANGTPEQTTITFDAATIGGEWFDFSGKLMDSAGQATDDRYYTGCGYPTYTIEFKHTLTMENGDVLVMDQKMIGESVCKICNSGLTHGSFTSNSESRETNDHFLLAYTAEHHNWYQNFLVMFESPLGDVWGVHAEEVDFLEPAYEVRYLNQDLEVIRTIPVNDYTRTSNF